MFTEHLDLVSHLIFLCRFSLDLLLQGFDVGNVGLHDFLDDEVLPLTTAKTDLIQLRLRFSEVVWKGLVLFLFINRFQTCAKIHRSHIV